MKTHSLKKEKKTEAPLISIIIRTKNEERWITFCLDMIFRQTHKNVEVIVVDNKSTDNTVSLAKKFPIKLVKINKYIPGKAINVGIRASKGDFIVCVSAHCIPKDEYWLEHLLRNFEDPMVAGVYGRQEPLSFSSSKDKRDLIITFGLDRRIQKKDHFFHNANSMFRRTVWEQFPFSETATNIEDRIWGKEIIYAGYHLIYEPDASVYHYHGIHQNNDPERERGVVRIIEQLENIAATEGLPHAMDIHKLEVVAFLPVKGRVISIGKENLLFRCIRQLQTSSLVKKIFVIIDDSTLTKKLLQLGVQVIIRPKELSSSKKTVEDIIQFGMNKIAKKGIVPDVVYYANYLFPFRPAQLTESLIVDLLEKNLDSVVVGYPEYGSFWANGNNGWTRIDKGFMSRQNKEPIFQSLIGLGCVTLPQFASKGHLLGDKIGIIPVTEPKFTIRISGHNDAFNKQIAKLFFDQELD